MLYEHTFSSDIPLEDIAFPTQTSPPPAMNNDELSPQGFTTDRPSGPLRGTSLSISTSRQGEGTGVSQSPGAYCALPLSSPYRTVSSPLPSPSTPQRATAKRSSTLDTPRSAGYTDKSLRFPSSSKSGSKSPTSPSAKRRSDSSMIDKRVPTDPKTNVYTQCGRHGDQWLFGGFPFDNIKKALERDKKE